MDRIGTGIRSNFAKSRETHSMQCITPYISREYEAAVFTPATYSMYYECGRFIGVCHNPSQEEDNWEIVIAAFCVKKHKKKVACHLSKNKSFFICTLCCSNVTKLGEFVSSVIVL